MGLNADERREIIEEFGTVVKLKLIEHLKPIETEQERHKHAVFGVNGDNGLMGDMRSIRRRLRVAEMALYIGQGAIAGLLAFKEKIFG